MSKINKSLEQSKQEDFEQKKMLMRLEHLEDMYSRQQKMIAMQKLAIKTQEEVIKLYEENPAVLKSLREEAYLKYSSFYNLNLDNKVIWPVATYLN